MFIEPTFFTRSSLSVLAVLFFMRPPLVEAQAALEPDATPEQRAAWERAHVAEPQCAIQIECLEWDRDAIDLGGPAALTVISAVITGGGGVAVFLAMLANPRSGHELGAGLAIAGSVAVAIGAFGTTFGAISWARNRRDRRRLTREIDALHVDLIPLVAPEHGGSLTLGFGVTGRF